MNINIKVLRDGEVVALLADEDAAFAWLLHNQGQSVAYAVKYSGYSVEAVTNPGVNLFASYAEGYDK